MNADKILAEIFGELWKGKYYMKFCDSCDTFSIRHDECRTSSCGGGEGCDECRDDILEFDKFKSSPLSYLSEEELQTYRKIRHLKKLITESLLAGFSEVNWKYLKESGKTCERDEQLFPELQQYKYDPIQTK